MESIAKHLLGADSIVGCVGGGWGGLVAWLLVGGEGGLPGATLFTRQLCLAHKGVSQGMRGRCAFPLCLAGFCCYSSSMNG